MLPEVKRWLRDRTSSAEDWTLDRLLEAKRATGLTVSVVLPARNEKATVGKIVTAIRAELVTPGLVDELVVVNSHSTDRTARVAKHAGARVVDQDAVLESVGRGKGKGEALWKGLAATTGDIVVFNDADLRNYTTRFVTGLLGPLLTDPGVALVKGFYDRPEVGAGTQARPTRFRWPWVRPASPRTRHEGGGRVTELVARPILSARWPQLAGVKQPLGGEYAGRRSLLERLPFPTAYGVELGLLLDTFQMFGLDAIAQVDLGTRDHSHQDTRALGVMAAQIMATEWRRLQRYGKVTSHIQASTRLVQFHRARDGSVAPREVDVSVAERPPLLGVPEYLESRRGGGPGAGAS
jgi:glucosyl-3-phosphoglycerate synthase